MYNLAQTGHSKKQSLGYAKKYFKKRVKQVREILQNLSSDFSPEKIHMLRIEIKRIKALLLLASHTTKSFNARKYFKPFKSIFEKAGEIRSVQIERALLEKYIPDNNDIYVQKLQKRELEKRTEVNEWVDKKCFIKGTKKGLGSILNSIDEKHVNRFLKKEAEKLAILMDMEIFCEKNLHEIRTRLKTFYFIAKTTYPDLVIPDPWNKFVELLGIWHDEQMTIEHLRKAIFSSQFDQPEIDKLYEVKQELVNKREALVDQIASTYMLLKSKDNAIIIPRKVKLAV
jgi:CHAD domain-containing protein